MRRVLLAALIGALSCNAASAQPVNPAAAIDSIATRPVLQHAIVAGEVYDLDTHRVLYMRNSQTLMEAASTTKLLTEGTSLALLGPDFRFKTPVYRTGAIDASGTLHGDVVLVASGDANLSQRIQPDGTMRFENEDHSYDGSYATAAVPGDPLAVLRELAAQIVKAGVKQIDGRVIVDTALFADAGPENGTGAFISPIVVNDNLIDVTVTPGAKLGDPATIAVSPLTSYATFIDTATTGAPEQEPTIDMNDDVQPNGTHAITVVGSIPPGKSILYAYRVPEPREFAQAAFSVALRDAGVTVVEPPDAADFDHATASAFYTPGNLIAQHVSPPLAQDVYVTLKVSDNLHADLMPYQWGLTAPATKHLLRTGFAREHALLAGAGLDMSGASQQDGLGTDAHFTPDFMVHYLAWARAQTWYPALLHALPILGVDGTLFNIQNDSPAKGKVFAKTGSWGAADRLNDETIVTAKGLAGYMTTRAGHHVAFCFYINRMQGKSSVDQSIDVTRAAGQLLGEMATATYLRY